jgi:hypothetical protein
VCDWRELPFSDVEEALELNRAEARETGRH